MGYEAKRLTRQVSRTPAQMGSQNTTSVEDKLPHTFHK